MEPIAETPPHRVKPAVMRQTWYDLAFLHWPYDAAIVRRLVPADLELDLYDGFAWIGLVPFGIEDLALPKAPALPWLSAFPETNVRTYVVDRHGLRGVWFFSLDAARLPAVMGARAAYALPYFWARMSVERQDQTVRYTSSRIIGPRVESDIQIEIGDAILQPSHFEVFLTARFRLYAKRAKWLLKANVEHQPWSLRTAKAVRLKQNLVEASGLPSPSGEPLVHFGGRVDVMVSPPLLV